MTSSDDATMMRDVAWLRATAAKLGVTVEFLVRRISAGQHWCSGCREWHEREKFYPKKRGHVVGVSNECRKFRQRKHAEQRPAAKRRLVRVSEAVYARIVQLATSRNCTHSEVLEGLLKTHSNAVRNIVVARKKT
jgi:alpha-D-ribose 1-methylphosphonate 5-triphosphate diphosphatase PhnM